MINTSITLNPNPICLGIGCILLLGSLGASAIIAASKKDKKVSFGREGFTVDNSSNGNDAKTETVVEVKEENNN